MTCPGESHTPVWNHRRQVVNVRQNNIIPDSPRSAATVSLRSFLKSECKSGSQRLLHSGALAFRGSCIQGLLHTGALAYRSSQRLLYCHQLLKDEAIRSTAADAVASSACWLQLQECALAYCSALCITSRWTPTDGLHACLVQWACDASPSSPTAL